MRGDKQLDRVYAAARALVDVDPPKRGDGRMLLHQLEMRLRQYEQAVASSEKDKR